MCRSALYPAFAFEMNDMRTLLSLDLVVLANFAKRKYNVIECIEIVVIQYKIIQRRYFLLRFNTLQRFGLMIS
jgi:hypothetical protein